MHARSKDKLFLFIFSILMPIALAGQASFNIGNITVPSYEKYILAGKDADQKKLSYIIEFATREDRDSKKKTWEIVSSQIAPGSRTDNTVVIRYSDLQPSYYKIVRTFDEGSYTETYELGNDFIANTDPKTFFFASPQMLLYVLRTFPFSSDNKEVSVRTFGSKAGGFNLIVKNNGLKKVKLLSGDTCDAYELEIGVEIAFWSAFIPKTYYYFRNDSQKTFVRFKGSFMPGSKETELELADYTTKS